MQTDLILTNSASCGSTSELLPQENTNRGPDVQRKPTQQGVELTQIRTDSNILILNSALAALKNMTKVEIYFTQGRKLIC